MKKHVTSNNDHKVSDTVVFAVPSLRKAGRSFSREQDEFKYTDNQTVVPAQVCRFKVAIPKADNDIRSARVTNKFTKIEIFSLTPYII